MLLFRQTLRNVNVLKGGEIKMNIKRIIAGFLGMALLVTVAACGSSSDSSKTLSFNLRQEPPQMNSILTTTTGSGNVLRHVMEGLINLDENDEPVPGVAESWEVSDDGMTYTFKLREDSKWSNDESVTAHDFVFAFNQLFTASTGAEYAGTWAPLIVGAEDLLAAKTDDQVKEALKNVGYKAIDDYTLEIKLTGPYSYFTGVLAFYSFLPVNEKAYEEFGGVDGYAQEADKMLYNGAFTMTSWTHEDSITLEKNEKYWDADKINLDKIEIKMISDYNSALNEFDAGSINMIDLTGAQAKDLKGKGTETLSYDDGSSWYLEFNTTFAGLDNAKIRKAMTLAVDAEKYVEKVVLNDSKVANSFVPAAIVQGTFTKEVGDLMHRPTDGDFSAVVKMFEEGLAEAGLTRETFKPEMIIDDTTLAATYGAYIKEQMNTVLGVDVAVSPMTYKARIARMQSKDFDIVMAGWGPDYNDPMTFLDLMVSTNGNNHTSWSNAEYDAIVNEARMEGDADKRTEQLIKLEKILAEEMPLGYIYNRSMDYIVSDGVTGVIRTAFSDIDVRYADIK